ncbi:transmembrane protein, putative (macronuclear) [Tetrahymena thermophila SB210]|uniref:Transmembrane protein, putative n=1 Tax=Tetrahymena thermophila (strain SB210) TaxID=312017 RepID=W7WZW3_TETTS|nr:transmembrane protein, putative [Tetrahymena thermophila SB210]EWS71147.1 transmembrane protein, putative [Tetrahymena thermophila SB210]|eukprot:XP_012656321.1 transmembrane protein, putative [Tetrahymena thermophila SB210]
MKVVAIIKKNRKTNTGCKLIHKKNMFNKQSEKKCFCMHNYYYIYFRQKNIVSQLRLRNSVGKMNQYNKCEEELNTINLKFNLVYHKQQLIKQFLEILINNINLQHQINKALRNIFKSNFIHLFIQSQFVFLKFKKLLLKLKQMKIKVLKYLILIKYFIKMMKLANITHYLLFPIGKIHSNKYHFYIIHLYRIDCLFFYYE